MIELQPKELLDRLAAEEMAGRHLDLRAVEERARQLRRRRVLGTTLGAAGLAASVMVAAGLATSGAMQRLEGGASSAAPGAGARASARAGGALQPSTSACGSARTRREPPPSCRALPSPTPSPSESPKEVAVDPAYRIPAAAGLTKSEVPAPLVLWEDTGQTKQEPGPQAVGVMFMCEDDMTGDERLGAAHENRREWTWNAPGGNDYLTVVHNVTRFAAGTGAARFQEVSRNVRACRSSDKDVQKATGSVDGWPSIVLNSTETDLSDGGSDPLYSGSQYAEGIVRVGDNTVISVKFRLMTTRPKASQLIQTLLHDAVAHFAAAAGVGPAPNR